MWWRLNVRSFLPSKGPDALGGREALLEWVAGGVALPCEAASELCTKLALRVHSGEASQPDRAVLHAVTEWRRSRLSEM